MKSNYKQRHKREREKRHLNHPFPCITLAAAIKRALNSPRIKRRLNAVQITSEWESLVGSNLAQHVQPVSLHKGLLTLQADSSVWRQQICFMKEQLLEQISSRFKEEMVRDLRIK